MKRPGFVFPLLLSATGAIGVAGCGAGATPTIVQPAVVTNAPGNASPAPGTSVSPTPLVTAPAPALATPGPPLAYMTSVAANTFASAIGTASTSGVVSDVSSVVVTATSGSAPSLTSESVSIKAGTAATAFDRSRTPFAPAVPLAIDTSPERPTRGAERVPFFARHSLPERGLAEGRASDLARIVQRASRAASRDIQRLRRTQSLPTTVGATASFSVDTGAIGNAGASQILVPATLGAVSAHGYIWLDSTLTLPAQSVAAIAADFENAYVSDSAHFGPPEYVPGSPGALLATVPCDSAGVPIPASLPVPLFITPAAKNVVLVLNGTTFGANVGGYFSAVNLVPQAVANCVTGQPKSNETPMIVVEYDTTHTSLLELQEDVVRATAHELQHEINYVSHTILAQTPNTERRWIDEGLSMLAQDFAVHAMFPAVSHDVDDALGHANEYLTSPSKFSLTGFSGIDSGSTAFSYACSGCYGVAYLFQRYLYDRFGEDAYAHAMETSTVIGAPGIARITGVTPALLMSDFALALLVSRTGFTSDPRYNFSLDLFGSFTDQFGQTSSLAGPGAFAVSPGATRTVTAYAGTFHYVQIHVPASQGSGITVSDPAGTFGLSAALVQF